MANKILSKKFYEEMDKLVPRYPSRVALLLPALHQAQEETSWLPPEVLEEIGAYIGIHAAQVREVASFYTMYNLKPVGKYHIKICTNVACCLRGADELVEHCEKKWDKASSRPAVASQRRFSCLALAVRDCEVDLSWA